MVISVLERRGEIGLRRALGATRGHISLQFLAESALLAAIGGVFGLLIGAGATEVYCGDQTRAVRGADVRADRGALRRLRDRRARGPVPGGQGRPAQPDRGAASVGPMRLRALNSARNRASFQSWPSQAPGLRTRAVVADSGRQQTPARLVRSTKYRRIAPHRSDPRDISEVEIAVLVGVEHRDAVAPHALRVVQQPEMVGRRLAIARGRLSRPHAVLLHGDDGGDDMTASAVRADHRRRLLGHVERQPRVPVPVVRIPHLDAVLPHASSEGEKRPVSLIKLRRPRCRGIAGSTARGDTDAQHQPAERSNQCESYVLHAASHTPLPITFGQHPGSTVTHL